MKSEHRHELKTNELAQWLNDLPQWAKQNRNMIIYVSVFVVVVAVYWFWYNYQKNVVSVRRQTNFTSLISSLTPMKIQILRSNAAGMDTSFNLIQVSDALQAAAQDSKDNHMAALALIKRAETLRTELHYRLGTSSEQEIAAQLDKAQASYTEAISRTSAGPQLMAMAKFGIGLCEEERGNFAAARGIYNEIVTSPGFEGTTTVVTAKQRLDTMADYQKEVVFKPAPVEAQPLRPMIELAPRDINLPG